MKRRLVFLVPVLFLTLFYACAVQMKAPVQPAQKETLTAAAAPSAFGMAKKEYVNSSLGFSFKIPDSWDDENYSVIVSKSEITEAKAAKIQFLFQGDPENPLLIIDVIWTAGQNAILKPAEDSSDTFSTYKLTEGNGVSYYYTLPQASTFEVGAKADLYNSMMLPREEVINRIMIRSPLPSSQKTKK